MTSLTTLSLTPRTVRRAMFVSEHYCPCRWLMAEVVCINGDEGDCVQQAYRCEQGHLWMRTWLAHDVEWGRIGHATVEAALVTPTAHSHLRRKAG